MAKSTIHVFKINMVEHSYLPLQSRVSLIKINNAYRDKIKFIDFKWNLLFSGLGTIILIMSMVSFSLYYYCDEYFVNVVYYRKPAVQLRE
jgi:hypothetical protein